MSRIKELRILAYRQHTLIVIKELDLVQEMDAHDVGYPNVHFLTNSILDMRAWDGTHARRIRRLE